MGGVAKSRLYVQRIWSFVTDDPREAVKGVDFIHTDVWVSMGEPKEVWKERIDLLLRLEQVRHVRVAVDRQPVGAHRDHGLERLRRCIGIEARPGRRDRLEGPRRRPRWPMPSR